MLSQKLSQLLANKRLHIIALALIILIGGFFRLYRLNWDESYTFHPDERNIANAVIKVNIPDQLDPGFHAYNGFSIYMIRGIAQILVWITGNSDWVNNWGNVNMIGRTISAIASTASIYLIYVLVRKLLGKNAALFATFISAFTVGLIQYSHYGVTESLLVFFLLLIGIASTKILDDPSRVLYWIVAGILCGLAIGTKTSAISFLAIPFVTWLVSFRQNDKKLNLFLLGVLFVFVVFIFFFASSPFTLLHYDEFRKSMKYEGGVVSGTVKVPYTVQFEKTTPFLFFFQNLHWQVGLILPTIGALGILIWSGVMVFKRKTSRTFMSALPFLAFGILYFIYVGRWYTKFLRYMIPFIPVLILATTWVFYKLYKFKKTRYISLFLVSVTMLVSFLWSLAYLNIFHQESTRITASKWFYSNIPEGTRILHEHWDDRVPNFLRDTYVPSYNFIEMTNYDGDSPTKIEKLSQNLANGEYLVLSSKRLSGSIGRAKWLYPYTSNYYRLLFDNKLGYKLVQEFTSYPKIGSLEINDDAAEETFQVYDHPKILVFKNEGKLSEEEIYSLVMKTTRSEENK